MTAQLPSKVRLAQIASFTKSMALPPSHDEIEAMARAILAAHEQEPIGAFHISGGTVEATTDYCKDGEWPVQDGIVEVYARPAPAAAVQDELRSSLQELVKAMRDYEMDVGEPAPYKHREMMRRAEALLNGGKS